MALFVLRKLILQKLMRSHPVGLDVWCLVGSFVYFHTSCVRIAKALARLHLLFFNLYKIWPLFSNHILTQKLITQLVDWLDFCMNIWCRTIYLKHIGASSWDYGTFRPPKTHSSKAHAQPSCGARCLMFGRTLRLLPYFMCANSEGSGRLSGCAGSPEPSLVAYVISTIISWAGSLLNYSQRSFGAQWVKYPQQGSLSSNLIGQIGCLGPRRLPSG